MMKFAEWLKQREEWLTGGGNLGNAEPIVRKSFPKKAVKNVTAPRYNTIVLQPGTQGSKIDPGS